MLLPPERRRALHAVYAFCRFIDDIADDESIREPALLLKRWREELDRVYAGTPTRAISRALADSARRFKIPRELFEEIIAGVEMDLSRKRYAELRRTAARTAIGSRRRWGSSASRFSAIAIRRRSIYAENLGLAFQLTNILRDVREDAERGRIYLPLEDLARFGVTRGRNSRAACTSPNFVSLMEFEATRAREFYAMAQSALAPRRSRDAADRRGDAAHLRRAARTDRQARTIACSTAATACRRRTSSTWSAARGPKGAFSALRG